MAWLSTTALLTALIFLIIGQSRVTCVCDNVTLISTQLDLLLAEYDRGALLASPVHVAAALDIQHATIDERSATVRLLASLFLKWQDERLSWNASSWGCNSALVAAERLWLPDVGVLSAATVGSVGDDLGLRARVYSDGRVSWVVRLDLVSPITLALDAWPRDMHIVNFKFGSRSHTTDELNLTISDLAHATVFESGTWELMSAHSSALSWKREDTEQHVLEWSVTLRRRAAAHVLATHAVLAASVTLLIAAVLLPPASRPALCATAALATALWLITALGRLPGASSAPLVMSLMCTLCISSAMAAAGAALVLRVARCSAPPPHNLRSIVNATSAFCKLVPPEGSTAEWSAWAAAAQLLDYVMIAAMLLTLFIIVCLSF